ncbi:MAG: hypothetical protein DHS20C15_05330 [Planctomycetota bacterium]|nr:MAG: hypothetical protein DHS20C15_05330 [Planctomycetota bacterium]
MTTTVAVLATLDTKGREAAYVRERIEALGGRALLIDMGVLGEPGTRADITREQVAQAGGTSLADLLAAPTRQAASPVFIAGATKLLLERIAREEVHAVLAMGGTQGTSNATAVMQALPYGFPKLMVSTVASGDTAPFVGIKDITMMSAVGDILGLNPLTRTILANAAGAAWGMAQQPVSLNTERGDKALIGMTNLGVLTTGAQHAIDLFHERGYEVLTFHAVGAGGLAMEQLMRDGVIGAVFDYSLGELADELFDGLRAANAERLTVAGALGLPQVICPGGAEHVGIMVSEPNVVPERWAGRPHVFHNPIILAPRLSADEFAQLARVVGERLADARGPAAVLMPMGGTSRYSVEGGPLHDPAGDRAFADALRDALPEQVAYEEHELGAEDPAFVRAAVERLVAMIEASS